MKLSRLHTLCLKAIEKYGDMEIGVFPSDDAYDINDGTETYQDLYFRVVLDRDLPGETIDDEEENASSQSKSEKPTAVLFYS
jgi:hypothetical protein